MFSSTREVKVSLSSMKRDISFLLLSLITLMVISLNFQITIFEALILFLIWLLYILTIYLQKLKQPISGAVGTGFGGAATTTEFTRRPPPDPVPYTTASGQEGSTVALQVVLDGGSTFTRSNLNNPLLFNSNDQGEGEGGEDGESYYFNFPPSPESAVIRADGVRNWPHPFLRYIAPRVNAPLFVQLSWSLILLSVLSVVLTSVVDSWVDLIGGGGSSGGSAWADVLGSMLFQLDNISARRFSAISSFF